MTDVAGTVRERLAPLPVVKFQRTLTVEGPRGEFREVVDMDWPAVKGDDFYKASLEQADRCWSMLLEAKMLRLRAEAGL